MYDEHYGLRGRPFQLTPDPAFWFDTATHRKAMAYLGYGLSQGEGFIVITGDPGAGKTTLVGHLMATIDPERLNVIRIVTTQVDTADLLRMVAAGLAVDHAGLTKAELLAAIERGLHAVARGGRRTLLIVDEAQSLPVASIEELRMLSNFQAGGYALLQIFLLGQPEFRQRLHGSDRLEQLRQRVIAMHHLDPMGLEEVEPYLSHRLGVVGWDGRPGFSTEAIAAMHDWSAGIPRRLNQLAGRVLLYGAIDGIERFERRDVLRVIADLDGDGLGAPDNSGSPTHNSVEATALSSEPTARFDEELLELDTPAQESLEVPPASLRSTPVIGEVEPAALTPPPPPVAPRPIHPASSAANMNEPDAKFVPPAEFDEKVDVAEADADNAGAVEASLDEFPNASEPQPFPAFDPVSDGDRDEPQHRAAEAVDRSETERRLAAVEARLEEQDAALRRVLTLLVDWVEGDARRPDLSPLRDGTQG